MKQVVAFQANDGKLFVDADEARFHDELLRISEELSQLLPYEEGTAYKIAVWINQNFVRKSESNDENV